MQRYASGHEEMSRERARRDAAVLALNWLPGEVRVDFGKTDFRVSNGAQIFWDETAKCVCQGLRSVFEFVGGVPRRVAFGSATEIGRRVRWGLREGTNAVILMGNVAPSSWDEFFTGGEACSARSTGCSTGHPSS